MEAHFWPLLVKVRDSTALCKAHVFGQGRAKVDQSPELHSESQRYKVKLCSLCTHPDLAHCHMEEGPRGHSPPATKEKVIASVKDQAGERPSRA